MTADNRIETERLLLRRPRTIDADAIFRRYSSDPDVTRYLGWLRHHSVDEVLAFIRFSDGHWEQWGCGPYLIERTSDRQLVGGTGAVLSTGRRRSASSASARRVTWTIAHRRTCWKNAASRSSRRWTNRPSRT